MASPLQESFRIGSISEKINDIELVDEDRKGNTLIFDRRFNCLVTSNYELTSPLTRFTGVNSLWVFLKRSVRTFAIAGANLTFLSLSMPFLLMHLTVICTRSAF